jgi:hypothetical protein
MRAAAAEPKRRKRPFNWTSRERFPSASTVGPELGERRLAQRFPGFADTEGVTGSNPVASTTVLAGQRRYQRLAGSAPHTPRPRCGRSLRPAEPDGPSSAGRHETNTSATTTQRGHHLPVPPMVEQHAGNLPKTHLRGTREHLLPRVLPSQPTGTLALDQLPWSARRRARRRSRCDCEAAAQACRRPSCQPRTANARPSLSQPGRIRAATTNPLADHSDPSNPVRQIWAVPRHRPPGSSAVRTARTQRPRTPDACLSGRLSVRTPGSHRSPGHRTRVDTGRPRDQADGRPHGGESDERRGRRPDILDGHDGGGRRLGGPNLARVAPSSALGNR